MPRFSNEGFSLAYEVHGSGQPVVMLHGAAVSFAGNFGACGWIDPLTARGLQVVGLDFRGHGGSDKPLDPSLHGIEPFTRDVIALMDHLDIEQASIVGYSIGTTVSLHLLHTHPERFRRSALVATGEGIIGFGPHAFPLILPPMVEILHWPELPEDVPPAVAFYYNFAESVGGSREGVAAALSGDFSPCTPEEASEVAVPVLVVSGDQDVVLGTGRRLAETLPRGTYMEIPGADHFLLAVNEDVQRAVARFLTEEG
ncbi:MAG: alpha/beta fold hydrolase [Actinomycetota bacterium]